MDRRQQQSGWSCNTHEGEKDLRAPGKVLPHVGEKDTGGLSCLSRLYFARRLVVGLVLGIVGGVLAAGRAEAGLNQWTSHGPGGGQINTLVINPQAPTTLYAGTFSGGVFESSMGGELWGVADTGLTSTDIRALAIDPQTPTTLYAGVYLEGVFKSTNGGGSWAPRNTGLWSSPSFPGKSGSRRGTPTGLGACGSHDHGLFV